MEEIAKFIVDELGGNTDTLIYQLRKHSEYGTLLVFRDDKGIYAVARWNIDLDIAYIIDAVIRKDKRGIGVIKEMAEWGRKRFPYVNYLRYERGAKGQKMNIYKINKFLKEK